MDADSTAPEASNRKRPVSIFLSYRREDSMYPARFLWRRLRDRFGEAQVFMDVGGIRPGTDFAERLLPKVRGSDVLLALIGQRWAGDHNNRRRLDDPDDWVRREIAEAIRTDRRVIPVLLEDARIPRASELPRELHRLPRFNAVTLTADRWDEEIDALIAAIELPPEPPPMVDWREPTVTPIYVGGRPSSLAFANGAIWVADWANRSVCRINPAANEVSPGVRVELRPETIAADERGVWVYGGWRHQRLVRIDPASGRVAGPRKMAMLPLAMAVGQGGVWVAYLGRVVRMDPTDPAADRTFRLGTWRFGSPVLGDRTRARRIVVGDEGVWVATARGEGGLEQAIHRIDSVTGAVESCDLNDIGESISAIAVGGDEVWAATASRVLRIDFASRKLTMSTYIEPFGIALAEGSLWITTSGDERREGGAGGDDQGRPGFLCRIDPGRPTESHQQIAVGRDPGAVMVAMGSVWVANPAAGTVSRVDRALQSKLTAPTGRT